MNRTFITSFGLIMLLLAACQKSETESNPNKGQLGLLFYHTIDEKALLFDTLAYENAAGNSYLVNEIQYFISKISLTATSGNEVFLDDFDDIHYVDTDLSSTFTWNLPDEIPPGNFTHINFTFGLDESMNQSFIFVNPPESLMFWPEYLGGGYHYLKLNGKWLTDDGLMAPFNFHLGIGQIYDDETQEIIDFVHNHFRLSLAVAFEIEPGKKTEMGILMHIENWFKDPNVYDHNYWGGDIMENQKAMKTASENGALNVFEARRIVR